MCVNSLEEDQEEDATWSPTIAGNNLVEKSGGGVLPAMEGDPRYKIYELNRSHVRYCVDWLWRETMISRGRRCQ